MDERISEAFDQVEACFEEQLSGLSQADALELTQELIFNLCIKAEAIDDDIERQEHQACCWAT